jgi:UDP-2,3-diacylglucosamine pyrophosphatase LpxH
MSRHLYPMEFRQEVVVISDVHLGTYGSAAAQLVSYLKSIKPKVLILNGDIIDIWQFNKRYFPDDHMKVIREIIRMLSKGTEVHYITGNHDESLRRFSGFTLANFHLDNKVILDLPTGKAWVFHGDVFDFSIKHSKWIAKLGGKGYDLLILLNTFINWSLVKMGKERISISKKVKDKVKGVISYINNFEENVAQIAMENDYRYVICGHIHQPCIKDFTDENGKVTTYLNSGDWVENNTALEYNNGEWKLIEFKEASVAKKEPKMDKVTIELDMLLGSKDQQ